MLTIDGKITSTEKTIFCGKNSISRNAEIHCCIRLSEHHAPVAQWIEQPYTESRFYAGLRLVLVPQNAIY